MEPPPYVIYLFETVNTLPLELCMISYLLIFLATVFYPSLFFDPHRIKIFFYFRNKDYGHVWFIFLKTKKKNTILVLSKNYFCSMDLVLFSVFFKTNKKMNQICPLFSLFSLFSEDFFFKIVNKHAL